MHVRNLVTTLAAALVLTVALPAGAAGAAADEATLGVTVIHASGGEGGVDPALKPLERYLTKSFARFQSFKRLSVEEKVVKEGGTFDLTLPDKKRLSLKYLGSERGFVKVNLALDSLKTTINVKDGGLFFQAGRVYGDGILVLAISAKTGEPAP